MLCTSASCRKDATTWFCPECHVACCSAGCHDSDQCKVFQETGEILHPSIVIAKTPSKGLGVFVRGSVIPTGHFAFKSKVIAPNTELFDQTLKILTPMRLLVNTNAKDLFSAQQVERIRQTTIQG